MWELAIEIAQWKVAWVLAPVLSAVLAAWLVQGQREKKQPDKENKPSIFTPPKKTGLNRSKNTPTKQQRP